MDKAYQLKDLVDKVKDKGMEMVEDEAMLLIDATFEWLSESAVVSKTPFDNMLATAYPMIKKMIKNKADMIDGKLE